MSNNSSENLQVNYKQQPKYVDIDQINFQKKALKKAKADQLDHLYNQNYQPAKYAKALNYKNVRSYKKKLPSGQYKQIDTFEDTDQLKHFGLGPYFFVEYMRRISWIFFVFSLLEGFRIYVNYISDGLSDYTPSFSTFLITTTLGNYNGPIVSEFDNYIMAIVPGVIYAGMLIFYFIWKFHYYGQIDAEEEDHSAVHPEKFCFEVQGLDQEHTDQRELERFFSTFGPVYEISPIRRFKNKLNYFQQLDQLEEEIKEEQLEIILGSGDPQNLAALKREKQKLSKFINTLRIHPKIVSAYVHFQYEKSKVDCLAYFNDHYLFDTNVHSCMRDVCCCCIDKIEDKYLFKGRALTIKNAVVTKPEDINWQSYDIDNFGKCFRVFIAIAIIIIFIAISCSIIGICSIYISTHVTDCSDVDTSKDCPTDTCTVAEKDCYCNSNMFNAINDEEINTYCGETLDSIYLAQGIQYAVVAISGITNFLFGFVCGKVVDFTRPATYSSGLMAKTVIYTLFMIFNTVFIPILIYSDIYGFKTTDYASLLTLISSDLNNALKVNQLNFYLDFTKIWYSNVSPIFTNYIIFDVLFTWFFFIYYKCIADKSGLKDDQGTILQKTMNEKIISFQLNIYVEYSYFNLITFMGLFLSPGIPAAMPLAFIALLSKYVTYRSILQKDSSKIEGLGVDFMAYPLTFLPLIIIIGPLFGGWMLTASEYLIPPNLNIGIDLNLPEQFNIYQLIRMLYLPYMLIIALLMLIWFLFDNTLIRFCSWVSSFCFEKKLVVHPYHTKPFSDYAKNMNVLTSYNIRNNDKFRNAILNLEKYLVINDKL